MSYCIIRADGKFLAQGNAWAENIYNACTFKAKTEAMIVSSNFKTGSYSIVPVKTILLQQKEIKGQNMETSMSKVYGGWLIQVTNQNGSVVYSTIVTTEAEAVEHEAYLRGVFGG